MDHPDLIMSSFMANSIGVITINNVPLSLISMLTRYCISNYERSWQRNNSQKLNGLHFFANVPR